MAEPAIIVHGGARAIADELVNRYLEGVKRAAREGFKVLQNQGTAVDAVVAAVSVMEDDTIFNAGHGAALNAKGEVELDALLVDGKTLNSGGVTCVQDIANPIQLAKAVMEKTEHCLLVGQGANDFAKEQGFPRVTPNELVTEKARKEFEKYKKYSHTVNNEFSKRKDKSTGCDTVGAVAIDCSGNLASGTSTGGITAKLPGRMGDTPIIGSGGYADNEVGAVSSTGHGESIMKVCLTRRVGEYIEKGCSAKEAANLALNFMMTRVGGAGGLIVISKTGDVAHAFTSERMSWADISNGVLHYGIDPQQELDEDLML